MEERIQIRELKIMGIELKIYIIFLIMLIFLSFSLLIFYLFFDSSSGSLTFDITLEAYILILFTLEIMSLWTIIRKRKIAILFNKLTLFLIIILCIMLEINLVLSAGRIILTEGTYFNYIWGKFQETYLLDEKRILTLFTILFFLYWIKSEKIRKIFTR